MESKKIRLDSLVATKFSITRTQAQEYIKSGCVFLNNKQLEKANLKIDIDADIILNKNQFLTKTKCENLTELKKDLEIIYEDEYIIIVNKPNNIIVHPTSFNESNTLANIVEYYFNKNKINYDGDKLRNGIVHRLDKDTTGLIIIAKNKLVYDSFVEMMISKKITKKYLALMHRHLNTKVVEVQAPIDRIKNSTKREVSSNPTAKDATTIFREIKKYSNFSLVECELLTGRTHQIRVHAKYIQNHILNDPLYSPSHITNTTKYGQYLFAYYLEFHHPFLNKKIEVKLDMPKEFDEYIKTKGDSCV